MKLTKSVRPPRLYFNGFGKDGIFYQKVGEYYFAFDGQILFGPRIRMTRSKD